MDWKKQSNIKEELNKAHRRRKMAGINSIGDKVFYFGLGSLVVVLLLTAMYYFHQAVMVYLDAITL